MKVQLLVTLNIGSAGEEIDPVAGTELHRKWRESARYSVEDALERIAEMGYNHGHDGNTLISDEQVELVARRTPEATSDEAAMACAAILKTEPFGSKTQLVALLHDRVSLLERRARDLTLNEALLGEDPVVSAAYRRDLEKRKRETLLATAYAFEEITRSSKNIVEAHARVVCYRQLLEANPELRDPPPEGPRSAAGKKRRRRA